MEQHFVCTTGIIKLNFNFSMVINFFAARLEPSIRIRVKKSDPMTNQIKIKQLWRLKMDATEGCGRSKWRRGDSKWSR